MSRITARSSIAAFPSEVSGTAKMLESPAKVAVISAVVVAVTRSISGIIIRYAVWKSGLAMVTRRTITVIFTGVIAIVSRRRIARKTLFAVGVHITTRTAEAAQIDARRYGGQVTRQPQSIVAIARFVTSASGTFIDRACSTITMV